jgi:hypothetical protein
MLQPSRNQTDDVSGLEHGTRMVDMALLRSGMVYRREGQVQRRGQKTTGSGNQPAQDDEAMKSHTSATPQARNARTYVPIKERLDQLSRTEDAIQPADARLASATGTGKPPQVRAAPGLCDPRKVRAQHAPVALGQRDAHLLKTAQ